MKKTLLFRAHGPATAWRRPHWLPASFLRLTLQTCVEEPGGATPARSSSEACASLHPPLQPSRCWAQSHCSACKPPTPPVRALIMDAVKGEESEPVPYHPCDPPPRPFPAGTALSLYQAGGCGILSFTQQIHIKCSSAPVMVLASGDTVRNKTTCFPDLWGLYPSEEIGSHTNKCITTNCSKCCKINCSKCVQAFLRKVSEGRAKHLGLLKL